MISLIGYIPSSAENDSEKNRPTSINAITDFFIVIDSSFKEFPAPDRGGG
jgi:hypothetical protein